MKRLGTSILLALLATMMIATPVYADTEDPDSTPTIDTINIYRNLRETGTPTGDMLFIIYANIPYADTPDLPVTQTFIWRLIDTDNVTELGSTVGYAYHNDGYGYNIWSMYFTADNVTSLDIEWNTSYILRLSGNPAAFNTPPVYNFTISIADYSSLTDTADVKAELAARILNIADDLHSKWGLTSINTLLRQDETGTTLSTYGEAFFRGAIYGLQAMAPTVFNAVVDAIDVPARVWGTEYAENTTSQWADTWVETAQEAGKALFGTEYDLLSIIMLLGMSIGLLIGNIMLTGDHWNGLVDVAVFGVIGARLGMYDLAFLILVAALCWIYISMKVWFGMIK